MGREGGKDEMDTQLNTNNRGLGEKREGEEERRLCGLGERREGGEERRLCGPQ